MRASFNVVALALLCAMAAVHVAQASNIQITYQVFANTTTCEGTPFYTYGPYESNQATCETVKTYYGDESNLYFNTWCDNGALYVNTCNDSTCAYCSGAQQYTSNQCFVYPWYNQAANQLNKVSFQGTCSSAIAHIPAMATLLVTLVSAVLVIA